MAANGCDSSGILRELRIMLVPMPVGAVPRRHGGVDPRPARVAAAVIGAHRRAVGPVETFVYAAVNVVAGTRTRLGDVQTVAVLVIHLEGVRFERIAGRIEHVTLFSCL